MNALRSEPIPFRGPIGALPAPETGAGLPALSPDEARAAWENGAVFLDARSPEAWAAQRISGAPILDAATFPQSYYSLDPPLDPAIPLVVYGAGPDSFAVRRVAAELGELGHADVALVVAGLEELLAAGLPREEGPGGTTP